MKLILSSIYAVKVSMYPYFEFFGVVYVNKNVETGEGLIDL